MFSQIMVPVDLSHSDALGKAFSVAGGLARQYGAGLHLVSINAQGLSGMALPIDEDREKLRDIARQLQTDHGVEVTPHNLATPDPEVEVDARLMRAIDQIGCDLVVMASHVPGILEYLFSSHAGHLAAHAKVSVFVVR